MAAKSTRKQKEDKINAVSILHRDDLPLGGFAGLKEHRLVMDSKAFGQRANPGTWSGIGNFVYLADARFKPKGETTMHSHKEVDVISVMVSGQIAHEGSLEHGQALKAYDVQVQRAGGEGFSHNEINPDNTENRMIQLWALPEKAVEPAGYKLYKLKWGSVTRVYGGSPDQKETFAGNTIIAVALLKAGQRIEFRGPLMAYITMGKGVANDAVIITEGDLIRGDHLDITVEEKIQCIIVHTER